MEHVVAGALRREFKGRSDTAVALERFNRLQREDRERRERNEDINNDTTEFIDAAMLVISAVEMNEFRLQLDAYDAATVAALQTNDIALKKAQKDLESILGKAYVLPDGRRIFKTEDGLRVFDESGNELDASVVSPEEIEDFRPRWESVVEANERVETLEKERGDLIDYQQKLDEARERLDAGDITPEEFGRLQEQLTQDMPQAIRAELLGFDPKTQASLDQISQQPAEKLDITDDMIPASSTAGRLTALKI